MITKEYIAGFIDGEGHIGMRINKDKRTEKFSVCVKLCVVNTNKKVIEEIGKIWDKNVIERSNGQNNLKLYEIKIENVKEIKKALEEVIDYLIVKKNRAKIMIDYCDSRIKNFSKKYTPDELKMVERFKNVLV